MNDLYAYLFLGLILLGIWTAIYLMRHDLRHKLVKISLVGGFCGLIAEFWYYIDYWRPPVLIGFKSISLEDFIFGFAITGIAATIFDLIMRQKDTPGGKNQKKIFIALFFVGLFALLFFNTYLKVNSILVSSIAFLISSVPMLYIRRDLIKPALISGFLMTITIIPVYFLLFNVLFTDFWNKYWLLYGTNLDLRLLGNIPVTELIWYFSIGILLGVAYNFFKGFKKANYKS